MRVSEIRVNQIRVNKGLGVHLFQTLHRLARSLKELSILWV